MMRVLALLVAPAIAQTFNERIQDIVSNMTMDEKYSMLNGVGWSTNVTSEWSTLDGYYVGNIPGVSRLGIPNLNMQDAGQGFRTSDPRMVGQVTSWPCSLALASAWNGDLVEEWASAVADEYKVKGSNVILGPGLTLHRVARGGRNAEYGTGEDPLLGERLAPHYVKGFQSKGILTTMKHYGLNNQETNRNTVNSQIPDARALFEVYYPAFQAASDAGCASAMCSYNLVNGTHSCSSEQLLLKDLKTSMNFTGFVMSDWWATHSTSAAQGLDMDLPGNFDDVPGQASYFSPDSLEFAQVPTSVIDQMVTNILTPMAEWGLLDAPSPCQPENGGCETELYEANATSPEHAALAQKVAEQAVLLLQNNDNTLPLRSNVSKYGPGNPPLKVAVVGSACDARNDIKAMLAKWDLGNYYVVGGSGRVIPAQVTTIVQGLRDRAALDGNVTLVESLTDDLDNAKEAMQGTDLTIVCGGATSTEGEDRASLRLDQEDFINAVTTAGQDSSVPVAVVALAPGTFLTPFRDNAATVLALFFGGTPTGSAFASVIFGDVNPSARSPVTFPVNESDTVAPCSEVDCPYTEGLLVGYRQFDANDTPVAYPFGHGLSYTTFEYSWDPANGPPVPTSEGGAQIRVQVQNTGKTGGVEVVQIYATFPESDGFSNATKALKHYKRVQLIAGEVAVLNLDLTADSFRRWSNEAWAFETPSPGSYHISVGSSSRDIRLDADLDIHVEA